MNTNLLARETSPYLLQHQYNPVCWYPWVKEAFLKAKQENKPILLSIGYSACHWCHVMAHESFEDEGIAQLMNENFINIKVDREERPDLDRYYQHALSLMGRSGGWPLTMFLTWEGKPFWGGTYFPPTARYHLPSFADVLKAIVNAYKNGANELAKIGYEIDQSIADANQPKNAIQAHALSLAICDKMAERILLLLDPIHGGIAGAPKFPQVSLFQFLWRAYERTQNSQFKDAVILLLTQMSKGGIYDHLGGGYSRYSTDPYWLVPHFEKMLYDNAQIIELLTLGWQETKNPLFLYCIHETIAWLDREMKLPEGGFASALDADSEGEEGKFYTWAETEIDAVLSKDAAYFKTVYGVTSDGSWEGKNILNLLSTPDVSPAESSLKKARSILFKVRCKRSYPFRDDKVLTDWNGLTITALAHASSTFGQPYWLIMAKDAYAFIKQDLIDNDFVFHVWCKGQCSQLGFLDDYVALVRAAVTLYQITGEINYIQEAEAWIRVIHKRFASSDGSYFQSALEQNDIVQNAKEFVDKATPSSNGLMADVLVKLWLLTENRFYQALVENLFSTIKNYFDADPLYHATLLNAYDLWQRPIQITLFCEHTNPLRQKFVEAIYKVPYTNLVIKTPTVETLKQIDKAYAIICYQHTCSAPIFNPYDLTSQLKDIGSKLAYYRS